MKKLIMTLALTLFAVSVSAAPLQDFEYGGVAADSFDGFQVDVTGGERDSGTISFDNRVGRSLPMVLEMRVSSDEMKVVGEEFSLDAEIVSQNGDGRNVTELSCSSVRVSRNASVHRCLNSSVNEILPRSSNTVDFNVSVNPRIAPGEYDVGISVKSVIGEGRVVGTKNVSENGSVTVDAGRVSVSVNSRADANVTVKELNRVSAPSPGNSDFVGGVSVDVSNRSGDVEASGTVSISYQREALDQRDLSVFYYDDSEPVGQRWEDIGGTHYPGNNSVVAEVEHFSTYAAFAEQETGSSGGGDGDDTFITPVQDQGDEPDKTEPQDQGGEDEEQDQNNQQEPGQQGEQQEQEGGRETPDEGQTSGPKDAPGNGITGQFLGSPTDIAGIIGALIVAMIGVLVYTGRIELEAVAERIREKTG